MIKQINQNDDQYGNNQDTDDNADTAIPGYFHFIQLQGKLVKLLIIELTHPRLNFVIGKAQFGQPLADHLRLQNLLDLLQISGPVTGG